MATIDYFCLGIGGAAILIAFWWVVASSQQNLPDKESIQWQFETFEWFLRHFGGADSEDFEATRLVRPKRRDFPVESTGHELAEELFEYTRDHAGMSQWPCRLQAHDEQVGQELKSSLVRPVNRQYAAGTFGVDDSGEITITYSVTGLEDPEGLVATFAHELGHYLMADIQAPVPGGEKAMEPATDLCSIFMGFGIFQANAAFRFSRHDDAFISSSKARFTGYLNELELAYGLAIFTTLKELDPDEVAGYLDGNPRGYFRDAIDDIAERRGKEMQRLRAVNTAP